MTIDEIKQLRELCETSPSCREDIGDQWTELKQRVPALLDELGRLREDLRVTANKLALTTGVAEQLSAMLVDYELLRSAVTKIANTTDFCIVCEQHPSHGHRKDCPIDLKD